MPQGNKESTVEKFDGVCLDAANAFGRPSIQELGALGVTGVRLVAFEGVPTAYYKELRAAGITIALVLARESMGDDRGRWSELAGHYTHSIRPDILVVGNEMDAYLLDEPSPSSWSMRVPEYIELVARVREGTRELPEQPVLCGGGLVSGQPSWLQGLDPKALGLQALDVHPYGKDPGQVAILLDLYTAYGLPLYVLEWNRGAGEVGNMVPTLRAYTEGHCWFAWSDGMVPGYGLVQEDGTLTPEYLAYQTALAFRPVPTLAPTSAPTSVPEPREGDKDMDDVTIEDRIKELGVKLGPAIGPVYSLKIQPFENGLAVEVNGQAYVLPEVAVLDRFFRLRQ